MALLPGAFCFQQTAVHSDASLVLLMILAFPGSGNPDAGFPALIPWHPFPALISWQSNETNLQENLLQTLLSSAEWKLPDAFAVAGLGTFVVSGMSLAGTKLVQLLSHELRRE